MEFIIDNNKKIRMKAIIYITKSGNETIRKINIALNGAEFKRKFYSKEDLKKFVKYFLKYYNIPITLIRANYNCSYMDLPF